MQIMNLQVLNLQISWSIIPKTRKIEHRIQKGKKENDDNHN
jgi:hypothetical protein